MKQLITSNVTSTVSMPLQGTTLQFLEDSRKELILALAKTIIGDWSSYSTSTPYVLYGCRNSGSGSTYTISAGAILYNGEVFLVPAASFTTSGSNVAVVSNVTTYLSGVDPVTFSDANTYNIHQDKTYAIVSASSGSGAFNYADVVFLNTPTYVTYASNYGDYASGADRLNYIRQGNKVTINGDFTRNSFAAATTVFTLPSGYRPTVNTLYKSVYNITDNNMTYLQIDTSGNVSLTSIPLGTGKSISVNISFYI